MSLAAAFRDRLRLPVIAAPMFIASTPELVIEQCKAGIIGSFPALNARPAAALDQWLARIRGELDEHAAANPQAKVAPFAVNQTAHVSNDRLQHDMDACVRHQVPLIITSLRPPREIVDAAHSYGGLVFHDVINVRHARKAAEQGVDGIIAVCAGAGGHAGMAATVNGAAALGLAGEVGQVAPGFHADLALFDVRDHREIPYWYGDSRCRRTWVAGRPALGA